MFPCFPVPQLSTFNPQPVRQRVLDARPSRAHPCPMSSGLLQRLKFMGEKLQNLKPREAKPFTRKFMAKWEIGFQRFAISFRPSAVAFSIQPSLPRRSPAWRDEDGSLQPLAFASGANEKFHLSPSYRCDGFPDDEIKIVEGAAK
jgi:hypothetical protein